MKFENIFGINQDKFDWRFPTSLFFAFILNDIICIFLMIILILFPEDNMFTPKINFEIFPKIAFNLLFVFISIIILRFLTFKSISLKIVLISILASLISILLGRDSTLLIFQISIQFFATLSMLFIWKILIERLNKRKLSLVIGYTSSVILGLINTLFQMRNLNIDVKHFLFMFLAQQLYLIFLFWIGLLIFDKILKVKYKLRKEIQ